MLGSLVERKREGGREREEVPEHGGGRMGGTRRQIDYGEPARAMRLVSED